MGLVAPSTSVDTLSKLDGSNEPITTADIATAAKDTFTNRTAIAPQSYPNVYGTLLSYPEGTPVIVEYFKKRVSYIDRQTIDTSFSLERAAVHSSYDLVHNFEIRIKDQLQIQPDTEAAELSITGECIIYPGFNPNAGDVFFLKLPDNRIGLFVIDLITPMSIFRATHFLASFHLYNFVDVDIDTKLRASVAEELYFNKQSYFGGESTLLTDVSYNQLNSLLNFRKKLISRIMGTFYDQAENTMIRPDQVYDAYLVEFLTAKISVADTKHDIGQLCSTYIDDFDLTIWAAILRQDITQLTYCGHRLYKYKQYVSDTNISNVDKYNMLIATDTDLDPVANQNYFRLYSIPFIPNTVDPKVASYHFSNRFYYALIRSFEDAVPVTNVLLILDDMEFDLRVFPNLNATFYSTKDNAYHDISYFDVHNKSTGSNNDMHLPELEFMVFDYLLNNNIDISKLITLFEASFPFTALTPVDQYYYLPILLHLIDISLARIR